MANSINPDLPKDKELARQVLANANAAAEKGLLGVLWGNHKNAPNNIAGLLVIVFSLVGIVSTILICIKSNDLKEAVSLIKDFWLVIGPFITLGLGYLFGDKSSRE